MDNITTTGRRKSAIARVILKPGKGERTVNGRSVKDYFPNPADRTGIEEPFAITESGSVYDADVSAKGGGLSGQAGAVRLAVARALTEANAEFRAPLKKAGMLTRDSRVVERKKYGQPGARKKFQFSKR
ncbi:MAG: 30S ribosomal protein S9 [Fibrobacterota bacterium]